MQRSVTVTAENEVTFNLETWCAGQEAPRVGAHLELGRNMVRLTAELEPNRFTYTVVGALDTFKQQPAPKNGVGYGKNDFARVIGRNYTQVAPNAFVRRKHAA